jgi:hypothetical protein
MVELIGADALLHALADYEQIRNEEYEAASQEGMNLIRSPLREYAPERAQQRYVRTFHLQGEWDDAQMHFQAAPGGFTATMENGTPYGPYVQGDPSETPHQAAAFVNRWKPTSDILADNEGAIVAFFDQATERIVKRLGG